MVTDFRFFSFDERKSLGLLDEDLKSILGCEKNLPVWRLDVTQKKQSLRNISISPQSINLISR